MPATRRWRSALAEAAIRRPDVVVSSEEEPLILVDESDREIGHLSKGACHDGDGVLHRAFSLFIFNPAGELLLQQRSDEKTAVAALLVELLLQSPAHAARPWRWRPNDGWPRNWE